MTKPIVRRVLPVLAAAAVLFAGGSGAAAAVRAANPGASPALGPAATLSGWRIAKVLPNLVAGGLWAGGPRDAWLAGDACADPATCGETDASNGTVVVKHWDGTGWRSIAMPKAYVNTPLDQGVGAFAATSAANVWVFAGRGTESVDYTDALHWTGKGWTRPVRMNAAVEAAVATSPTQVWAFGSPNSGPQRGYYAHFNGTTWKSGGFPVEGTAAAALSGDDVWVGGQAASGALVLEHWDGHAWRATTLVAPGSASLSLAWITGIAAVSTHQVWAGVLIGSGGTLRSFLVHWNGTSWTKVGLPFAGSPLMDGPVASDGHGGVWASISIGTGSKGTTWFAHYAGGKWTKTAVPNLAKQPTFDATQIDQLTWIPGTRSLWAAGLLYTGNLPTALYKYGP